MTIVCAEHTAEKEKVTEAKLRNSNKNGFNNNVGTVTNRATAMYDILCTLEKDSYEYKVMKDRISSCQLLQQAVIDSAKTGFVTMEMPKKWYDIKKCETELDKKLCVNKKPYFMIYIYQQLKREYNSWKKQWNDVCYFEFGCTLEELRNKVQRTEEEEDFLIEAYEDMPVTDNNCLMNKLCHHVEKEFEGFVYKRISEKEDFDCTVLMYKNIKINEDIKIKEFIKKEIKEYGELCRQQYSDKSFSVMLDKDSNQKNKESFSLYLKKDINKYIEQNKINKKEFINSFIEYAYTESKNGKTLLWELFSEEIIDNLIEVNKSDQNL